MDSILDHVRWNRYKLPAGATTGEVDLAIGTVGEGKPTGLLVAGLHGDEGPWGAWAIRKTLEKIRPSELRGSLRIIPASNPSGVEVGKRNAALDLIPMDLNRSFPGDESGLHTERAAAIIAKHGVVGADAVVDVHGGGNWCVNAFVARFPGSESLADSVGAPFVMDRQPIPNTLTGYASGFGAKITLLEMGGIGSEEEAWANRVSAGIERALNAAGIIDTENKVPKSRIHRHRALQSDPPVQGRRLPPGFEGKRRRHRGERGYGHWPSFRSCHHGSGRDLPGTLPGNGHAPTPPGSDPGRRRDRSPDRGAAEVIPRARALLPSP